MNSLQEELYQLKSKDKNNSPSSRLKGVDADKSESASTIKDKSTDHGKKKKNKDLPKDRNHMSPICQREKKHRMSRLISKKDTQHSYQMTQGKKVTN